MEVVPEILQELLFGTGCLVSLSCPVSLFLLVCFFPFVRNWMVTIESEAYFDGRLSAMGVSAPTMVALKGRNWNTLADFAFASSYTPGQGDDRAFTTGVLVVILGPNFIDHADCAKLRRLYFEAHTLSIADLRRRTERTDSDQPIKLPAEERIVRLAKVRARLQGIEVFGVFEPSHALVDLLTQMLETSQMKYIGWELCTAREQEVHGIKKVQVASESIVADTSGFLKKQSHGDIFKADVTTDLLLTYALTRRALAFELANICKYETFAALTSKLMKEYMRPALQKYNKVSLEQLENADRFVFTQLAELTAGGVGVRGDGTYPVEKAMEVILGSSEFLFLLMQMPGGGSSASTNRQPKAEDKRQSSRSRSRRRKITEQQEKNRVTNSAGRGKAAKAKAGGKGRGKGGKSLGKAPFNPASETGRTSDGSPICYAYNTGGCTATTAGNRCDKGFHVCWKIGCGQPHAGPQHV